MPEKVMIRSDPSELVTENMTLTSSLNRLLQLHKKGSEWKIESRPELSLRPEAVEKSRDLMKGRLVCYDLSNDIPVYDHDEESEVQAKQQAIR